MLFKHSVEAHHRSLSPERKGCFRAGLPQLNNLAPNVWVMPDEGK